MACFKMRNAEGYVCDVCGYFTEDEDERRNHELRMPEPESLSVGFIFKSTRENLAKLLDNTITREYLLKGHSPDGLVYHVVHHLKKPEPKDHSVIHGIFVYELNNSGLVMVHNQFNYEKLEHYFAEGFFKFITDIEMEEFRKNHSNLDDDEFKNDQLTNMVPEKLEKRLVSRR